MLMTGMKILRPQRHVARPLTVRRPWLPARKNTGTRCRTTSAGRRATAAPVGSATGLMSCGIRHRPLPPRRRQLRVAPARRAWRLAAACHRGRPRPPASGGRRAPPPRRPVRTTCACVHLPRSGRPSARIAPSARTERATSTAVLAAPLRLDLHPAATRAPPVDRAVRWRCRHDQAADVNGCLACTDDRAGRSRSSTAVLPPWLARRASTWKHCEGRRGTAMTRITMLTPEQLDPELRRLTRADDRTPLELGLTRIFGHQPEMAKGLDGVRRLAQGQPHAAAPHDRAGAPADRLPQPVPQLHGHPLPGRPRRRPHRGPGLLAREADGGRRPHARPRSWPSATASCSPPTTSPSTTTSTTSCASTSPSRRSSSSASTWRCSSASAGCRPPGT